MINFDNFVIMREGFLQKLNNAIDRTIEEKKELTLDYDLLEHVLGKTLQNQKSGDTDRITKVVTMKQEEMLGIALSFFESIDPEIYKKALAIMLQQNDNVTMNIYDVHQVKNFSKLDEFGMMENTEEGSFQYTTIGHARINIPTRSELGIKETKLLNEGECTLEDLYTVVHETAHMLDLDLEKNADKREEILNGDTKSKRIFTRELLGESTAIAFEGLLTEYLLNNTKIPKEAIKQIDNNRINGSTYAARLVYMKLILANQKSKEGKITIEYIESLMRNNNFSTQFIRRMAIDIINDPRTILYEKRYALAGIISPTIVATYKQKGVGALKEYLQAAKDDNFLKALNSLGIEFNEQGLNKLIQNMRIQDSKLNEEEGR